METRPQILVYFEELEQRYGEHFTFDALRTTELCRLERLANHAIEADPAVSSTDRQNLRALLGLIRKQIEYRSLSAALSLEARQTG
ncbi:MAG: hypothetical protein HUJ28_09880 [Chromatiales bacterium]|nr:hypothetical protein [Chromatiales bacterium]